MRLGALSRRLRATALHRRFERILTGRRTSAALSDFSKPRSAIGLLQIFTAMHLRAGDAPIKKNLHDLGIIRVSKPLWTSESLVNRNLGHVTELSLQFENSLLRRVVNATNFVPSEWIADE